MIKERPILFSGAMVRAILEGRKAVTRRVVKPARLELLDAAALAGECMPLGSDRQDWGYIADLCPYGKPGDQLWVRETCFINGPGKGSEVIYKSDPLPNWEGEETDIRWRPSIHMPRWASRIQLEITAVRVERLQDGEGETAFESRYLAEGIHRIHHGDGDYYHHGAQSEPGPGNWGDPFDAWRELWQSINGPESWNANPWVWVVEFRRINHQQEQNNEN